MDDHVDAFMGLAAEFADGDKWKLLRTDGWDDFQVRLAEVVGDLSVRRRQALMMLLFALIEEIVTPADVQAFCDGHDLDTERGIDEFIGWLRDRRHDRA